MGSKRVKKGSFWDHPARTESHHFWPFLGVQKPVFGPKWGHFWDPFWQVPSNIGLKKAHFGPYRLRTLKKGVQKGVQNGVTFGPPFGTLLSPNHAKSALNWPKPAQKGVQKGVKNGSKMAQKGSFWVKKGVIFDPILGPPFEGSWPARAGRPLNTSQMPSKSPKTGPKCPEGPKRGSKRGPKMTPKRGQNVVPEIGGS